MEDSDPDTDEDDPVGWYAYRYGGDRTTRGFRIARDDTHLLRPGQVGDPALVSAVHNSVQHIAAGRWCVRSQRDPTIHYEVHSNGNGTAGCTCPDYADRHTDCKHIIAVALHGGPMSTFFATAGTHVTRAYFPMGSSVRRATGNVHGHTTAAPTGATHVEWDGGLGGERCTLNQLIMDDAGQPCTDAMPPTPAFVTAQMNARF